MPQQEQQINCAAKLTQTTALIQFCIEALKETDNAAFLQVFSPLSNNVIYRVKCGRFYRLLLINCIKLEINSDLCVFVFVYA